MADAFSPRFVDLVRNTTTTVGTGNFVLGAAVSGFTGFAAAIKPGESFYYSCIGVDRPNEREVGRGTMQANGTIARQAVSGALTNFSSGAKTIALIAAAEWFEKVQGGGGAGIGLAANRVALRAMTERSKPVLLNEARREGIFAFDASNLAAAVAADPQQGIYVAPSTDATGTSGAWVRQHGGRVTPLMFGAVDCTGSPKNGDEAVTDCSPALEGMWSIVKYLGVSKNVAVTMDLSGCLGLGVSREWVLDSGLTGALWNSTTFNIRPGRLVAMAKMENVVSLRNKSFQVDGQWELWGGTDTQLNAQNYAARFAKNGLFVANIGGSRIGDLLCQGMRRYGLKFSTEFSANNNNIPTTAGAVVAIQCGCRTADTMRFRGSYSTGVWENAPAHNGSDLQRHLMTLTPDAGVDPKDLEVGDLLKFGGTSVGVVKEVVSSTATAVTVRVWPWQPDQASGTFESMHGGAVSIAGGNTANTSFDLIEAYSCGTGLQLGALYNPTIKTFLAESTLCAVQIGMTGLESMEGLDVAHYHIESVDFSIIDFAASSGASFGVPSNLAGSNRGKFDRALRLTAGAVNSGVFTAGPKAGLRGLSFRLNGGEVHSPASYVTSRNIGGILSIPLGNAPQDQGTNAIYANSMTFRLLAERSLADAVVKGRVAEWGPIYGDGPSGAPTGNVTFTIESSQTGVTVEGGTSFVIPPGKGGLQGVAVYEPPAVGAGDNGNWKVLAWRLSSAGKNASSLVTTQAEAAYTAAPGDADSYIRFTNAAAITFTVPPNSAVAFPVGTVMEIEQAGAGALSVAAGAGVTINSRGNDLTLAGQFAVAALKKVAADSWTLTGDL